MEFFVGTLTRAGGEGILRCRLENNKIVKEFVYSDIKDPNYLILSRDRKTLYSTASDMTDRVMKGNTVEFLVTENGIEKRASAPTDGMGPCFLTLDAAEKYLYLVNYASGTVCVFPVGNGLQPMCQSIQLTGTGPDPVRQECAHPHQGTFLPGTDYFTVCDLGTDELLVYRQDPASGRLTENSRIHLHGGPRHIVYGEQGKVWLIHELSSEVTSLKQENGIYTEGQTLPALPADYHGPKNTGAAIRLSADGKKLYASNRGHGSIAIYDVHEDGSLTFDKWIRAGEFPRDFVVLKDGSMLVADQYNGVWYQDAEGQVLDYLPEKGAVAICMMD